MKCTLCDLSIHSPTVLFEELPFCCHGCKAVYTILSTKNTLANPRENPIFLQALQAGIISNPMLLEELAAEKKSSEETAPCERWHFELGEMWCPTCAELIRWVILREKGISHCVVDYATDLASVEFNPMITSKESLTRTIQSLGYTVQPLDETLSKPVPRSLYLRLAIASFCSLNVMMLAYPLYATFFDPETEGVGNLFAWISLYASLPVLTYSAWPIYHKFWYGLRAGLLGMEALVTTGIAAATALSLYELWNGSNYVYFDSMTVIVAFVLFGKLLETRAKFSAKEAFLKLSRALPRKGRKKIGEEEYQFVPLKEIDVGDTVVVFPGEKIVLDGIVEKGVGVCDESVMTGEPIPVKKERGCAVVAGTVLQQGEIHYIVSVPPDKSLLSRIVEMTHGEIGNKHSYVRPADTIVRWFIPIVFTVALLTGMACYFASIDDGQGVANTAILRMTAVLLISCPCAIGIAAPIVEGYLLTALASEGVMIRNRGVLSLLGREDVYLFDKTGTVTEGKFKVCGGLSDLSSQDRSILKTMASHSNHLIARAIADAVAEEKVKGMEVTEVISKGMVGFLGGDRYLLGSESWMVENGVKFSQSLSGTTKTVSFFACNDKILSEIILGDSIRNEIKCCLKELTAVKKVLLSGDREQAVRAIAEEGDFDDWVGEHSPSQKMEYVHRLNSQGLIVAMVGDGINDAPALTAAPIGISVLSASDLSIQVSDILLTTPKLSALPKMREMAVFSRKIVNQNLFWAFFYNVLGFGLAVGGMLSPLYAAAAMVASSLIVVGNAQRLRFHRTEKQ